MGTGAESNRNIHVSISFTSCITIDDADSVAKPASTDHTESLWIIIFIRGFIGINLNAHLVVGFERFGDDESLHASMSFFNMKRHSRNVDKNG